MTFEENLEIVRDLLKDARLEHKASCDRDPCPSVDRWEHEAFDALDAATDEHNALREIEAAARNLLREGFGNTRGSLAAQRRFVEVLAPQQPMSEESGER